MVPQPRKHDGLILLLELSVNLDVMRASFPALIPQIVSLVLGFVRAVDVFLSSWCGRSPGPLIEDVESKHNSSWQLHEV